MCTLLNGTHSPSLRFVVGWVLGILKLPMMPFL
ncbi:hypothetical protein CFP56_021478 [Quercus suber]|uniref:Uncharacterized protein n=1 Tax=Quercus suber TaxID=58331 RepID=A0AAW0KD60_QUESU